jgi:RpiB/LacA/LacB family sugar-phosphate isomerase
VADGAAERGVLFCWTGTGVSIAANKVPGVRAALCADAETARMARRYNHANVLVMSLRATAPAVAREILEAFLSEPDGADEFDRRNVARVEALDEDRRPPPGPRAS